MMKMKFSIIITTFNSELTIKKNLTSVLENFKGKEKIGEIIVVDDCSSDQTITILNTYLGIKVLHKKKNKGVGDSRNIGKELAVGEWLIFLDGDDTMEEKFLDEFLKIIDEKKDIDMIAFGVNNVKEGISRKLEYEEKETYFDPEKYLIQGYHGYFVNKIYRKEILKNILQKEDMFFQDMEVIPHIYRNIKKGYYTTKMFYTYISNPNSVTKNQELVIKRFESREKILNFWKKELSSKLFRRHKNILLLNFNYSLIDFERSSLSNSKKNEYKKKILEYMENLLIESDLKVENFHVNLYKINSFNSNERIRSLKILYDDYPIDEIFLFDNKNSEEFVCDKKFSEIKVKKINSLEKIDSKNNFIVVMNENFSEENILMMKKENFIYFQETDGEFSDILLGKYKNINNYIEKKIESVKIKYVLNQLKETKVNIKKFEKKRTIVLVSDTINGTGGINQVYSNLGFEFENQGYDVVLWGFRKEKKREEKISRTFIYNEKNIDKEIKNYNEPIFVLSSHNRYLNLIKKIKNYTIINHYHNSISTVLKNYNKEIFRYNLEDYLGDNTQGDMIVFLSRLDWRVFKYSSENASCYINNPIERVNAEIILKKLKIKKNICWIGRPQAPAKQIFEIIKLAEHLKKNKIHTKIFIYGDDLSKEFLYEVNRKKLNEYIEYKGYVASKKDMLEDKKYIILTSKYEGLPMSVLEAMSYGVVPIVYDCTLAFDDLIRNNETGFVVNNIYEMFDVIKNLEKKNEDEFSMILKNILYEMKNFDVEKIVSQWEKIFQEATFRTYLRLNKSKDVKPYNEIEKLKKEIRIKNRELKKRDVWIKKKDYWLKYKTTQIEGFENRKVIRIIEKFRKIFYKR